MVAPALLSSAKQDWGTPWEFYRLWDSRYHFTLDVCATARNAKCALYFSPEQDGLAQDWGANSCWCNPPYGRTVGKWVKKARDASEAGATVVMLLPSRTDTAWWHDYVMAGTRESRLEVHFVRGRIRFEGAQYPAPFPSVVVVFRPFV